MPPPRPPPISPPWRPKPGYLSPSGIAGVVAGSIIGCCLIIVFWLKTCFWCMAYKHKQRYKLGAAAPRV